MPKPSRTIGEATDGGGKKTKGVSSGNMGEKKPRTRSGEEGEPSPSPGNRQRVGRPDYGKFNDDMDAYGKDNNMTYEKRGRPGVKEPDGMFRTPEGKEIPVEMKNSAEVERNSWF